jgi:cephalosporin hydroxylase
LEINVTQIDQVEEFRQQVASNVAALEKDVDVQALSRIWSRETNQHGYTYNFQWLGRPIIQYPQDIVGMQELIWKIKPDLIIETGIAHGGSLIFSASMLALLDVSEAIESGQSIDPGKSKRKVLGVDIEIRPHNRVEIENHPMSSRIQMIEGSSIARETIELVQDEAAKYQKVMVCLDSNHTHDHVLAELEAFAPLVSVGSYCVVFDTLIEDMPLNMFDERPWSPGNSPKTAVFEYLKSHQEFEIDSSITSKLLVTVAPDGYLKRVK